MAMDYSDKDKAWRANERRIADNLDPDRFRQRRGKIRPSDGVPSAWAGLAKKLRSRLPDGVRIFIKSASRGDEDSVRVMVDDASLRRLTNDNAQQVEALVGEFAGKLSALLGEATVQHELTKCSGCDQEIDDRVCHCGEEVHSTHGVGHAFVPIGCNCYRVDDKPLPELRVDTMKMLHSGLPDW